MKYRNALMQNFLSGDRVILGEMEFNEREEFYGSDHFDVPIIDKRHLRKNYMGRYLYEKDYPNYKKNELIPQAKYFYFFDIEVDIPDNINFNQEWEKALWPVTVIMIQEYSGQWEQLIIETKEEEINILGDFLKKCRNFENCWIAYNANFDITYLRNRYQVLTGKWMNIISPVLDYITAYKSFVKQSEPSFKLDFILKKHLGVGKLEYTGSLYQLYRNDKNKYMEYNREDVFRLVKLDKERLHLIPLISKISKITHSTVNTVIYKTTIIENLIYHEFLRPNNLTFRNKVKVPPFSYKGAIIYDPIGGLHKDLQCFDFSSLYPTIVSNFNISPETLMGKLQNKTDIAIHCCNGISFEKNSPVFGENNSLFKSIAIYLLNERKKAKEMGDDIGQNAFKRIANSLYGVCGSSYFRFSHKDIAESITQQAKNANLNIVFNMELFHQGKKEIFIVKDNDKLSELIKHKNRSAVVFGHTDSIFIKEKEDNQKHVEKIIKEYEKAYQCLPGIKLSMKDEYGTIPAALFLWGIKANYYLLLKSGLKMVGGVSVKSNTNPLTKKYLKEFITSILKEEKTLYQITKEIELLKDQFCFDTPELFTPYKFNKLQDYKSTPRGLKGAINLIHFFPDYKGEMERGIIIEFLKEKIGKRGKPIKPEYYPLSIPEELYDYIGVIINKIESEGLILNKELITDKIFKPIEDLILNIGTEQD